MELLLGKERFAEIPPLGSVGGKSGTKTDLSTPSQAEVVLPPQLGTRFHWGCPFQPKPLCDLPLAAQPQLRETQIHVKRP